MEPGNAGLHPAVIWIIILCAMLSALAFVIFFILPGCANLPVWGKVPGTCGPEQQGIIAICAMMFFAGAAYSGYRIAGAVKGQRDE